jgi:type IV pilus assembly protein PilM
MTKTTVDSYDSCLRKAGLVPTVLEVESQTIVRSLVENEKSLVPLVLVDFGKDNTDFIIFSGDSMRFTCVIPVSSQQITQAISKEMNVDLAQAEKIKLNYNLSKKNDSPEFQKIAVAVELVLNNLAGEIKKYLEFHRNHPSHEHSLNKTAGENEKIILSGGGSELEGISDFLSQKLQIPVELADPWVNIPLKNNKKIVLSGKRSLSFSKVLGLALGAINRLNK